MNYLEDLLHEIARKLNENPSADTDKTVFNIFRVLGVQTKEVIICRFIGELLDPKGSHNMGAIALKQFFKLVLGEGISENIDSARVELEELIDGDRRVDIVIHIGNRVFPVEVKIWAGDQDAQLSDYHAYYQKHNQIEKIYYLTPYGWKPSKASIRELDDESVVCISFEKQIASWLNDLLSLDNIPEYVKLSIRQFKEIIFDMCADNEYMNSIMNILQLNDSNSFEVNDSLRAAVAIMNLKDDLTEKIIVNYLKKSIKVPVGYSLEEDKDKIVDKHSYIKIIKNNKPVAWICVVTNLYIVAQKVKTTKHGELWDVGREDYFWQYLHPNGNGKKFPLKRLECMFRYDAQIEIQEFLDDIIIE